MMICKESGEKHEVYDFDADGLSVTGCNCMEALLIDHRADMTPTLEGPVGEERYDDPSGDTEDESGEMV